MSFVQLIPHPNRFSSIMMNFLTLLSVLPLAESSSLSPDAHALLQVQQRVKQRSPLSMDDDSSKTPEDAPALLELQPPADSAPSETVSLNCDGGDYVSGDGTR